MAEDEKDRFGDKLRDAEKAREDTFFAERDRQLIEKLKAQSGETGHGRAEGRDGDLDEKPANRQRSGWLARLLGQSR